MENDKGKKILLIVLVCLVVICLGVLIYKYVETNNSNATLTAKLIQAQKDIDDKDKEIANLKKEENVEDETEDETVYSLPFVDYDDILYLQDKSLKTGADKINKKLRRVLALISLTSQKNGKYTLEDMDKLELNGLIVNNMFDDNDYAKIDAGIEAPSLVEASKYESVFKSVTGIENAKSYYKGLDYATKKDAKQSVYIDYNGKTYYIGKWGIGLEGSSAVITNISYSGTKTIVTIRTYEIDYSTNKVGYLKTITFELETNTLRIYNYTVS